MAQRARARQAPDAPISIYEVHAGSWLARRRRRTPDWDRLADRLIPYVAEHGLHPCRAAADHRASVRRLVGLPAARPVRADRALRPARAASRVSSTAPHAAGIGVILDWVPAHFPTDAHGLARFDGTRALRACRPARGLPPRLEHLHLQFRPQRGARLPDRQRAALARALPRRRAARRCGGLDALPRLQPRKAGEWIPNRYGGRENLEAVAFLQRAERRRRRALPRRDDDRRGIDRLARRDHAGRAKAASASPTNGTWAGCTTRCATSSRTRSTARYHHDDMTFGLVYAFSREFRPAAVAMTRWCTARARCCGKMPGDRWQQLRQPARLSRLHVGASRQEAAVHGRRDRPARANGTTTRALAWPLLDDPRHRGIQRLVRDLNRLYRRDPGAAPARRRRRRASAGWSATIARNSSSPFCACGEAGDPPVLVVCNMTPVPRHGYRIGVPRAGALARDR